MKDMNKQGISRRKFLKTSVATGAGVLLTGHTLFDSNQQNNTRKRYALVGVGSRSIMYQTAVQKTYSDYCQMVAFCDVNEGRLKLAQQRSKGYGKTEPKIYHAVDFDKMVVDTKPETIIVTTVDGTHDQYIIRAMQLGCDVITEKPMTTDENKCQAILDTVKKTGQKCTVTFNYRYTPSRSQVKKLLMDGVIGDILSVDFHWMLNTFHGADYFRRWHSQKKYSGGLMVHKSTHHFDLINWWLSAIPVTVYASGKRDFYTPKMAKRFGLDNYHERCHTCPEKNKCGFILDLAGDEKLKSLYLDNEHYDGYFRDKCVFRPEIDIEDTMNVVVKYDNNVTMSYSLNAFNSWEGYYVIFNGTKGRLEHQIEEKIYISGTETEQGGIKKGGTAIKIIPLRGEGYYVDTWEGGKGGHGGGDGIMLDDIFLPTKKSDEYLRAADQRSGAYSILTGAAANLSMKTGNPIEINSIVSNLDYPDYPEMPSHEQSLPMPKIG